MSNIASNVDAVNTAVSSLHSVHAGNGMQVSLSQSKISGMTAGAEVSNQLLPNISNLVDCVKAQSDKFKGIAEFFAHIDSQVKM